MKKLNFLAQESFLKVFFAFVSLCFVIAAFIMPDRSTMFTGLWKILSGTCKISTNYFALGGYAATFLNMGLVGLICTALCFLPGAKPNNVTTLGVLLTIGFGSWGINPLNIIPTILGVCLYCLVKKEKLGAMSNAMMYSTGIAPLISDLLFRYPGTEYVGFNALGLVLALNLCACACSNMDPATTPSTTNNTMMPTDTMTVPVPETNIPDPDIGPTGMPENNTTNGANGRANSVA